MFWADEVVEQAKRMFPGKKRFIIRDEKTASGRVHIGSLRGVVIHAVVTQALIEAGYDAEFFFEINDADPMDGLPVSLSKKFLEHMGKPLKDVPPPDANGEPDLQAFQENSQNNFARFYGEEFIEVIRKLGFSPTFYYASEAYKSGKFDSWIDVVLEHPTEIRAVYKEISGSEKGEEWNPLQIVCEKCGKVGTTTVVSSEGDRGKRIVEYACEEAKVKWAKGCGFKGKASPYGGRGKLPWKVEWGVKWSMFPVDIEGSGKDHQAASGSHDVASGIVEKVLKKAVSLACVPLNIPYEHFLFGGAKMSASKGIGASAKEVVDTLPPALVRFLMVRTRPEKAIDFDPGRGSAVPSLFDFFDEATAINFGREKSDIADDIKRVFHFSQLKHGSEKDMFRPRFSRTAFLIQMPQLNFLEEVEKLNGSPLTKEEKVEAEERATFARIWLQEYASENDKFEVQQSVPDEAKYLSAGQKKFLNSIAALLRDKKGKGEELHAAIHELRKNSPLAPAEGFQSIYFALLGKASGPQAGWFLDALPHEFVIKRFEEVAVLPALKKQEIQDIVTPLVIIDKEVRKRFPEIKLGFNVLKGAKIAKTHPGIPALREKLWAGLDFKGLKKNSPRLAAFAEIYQAFGINPNKWKPSPTALITRLANGKELPNINVAVDIYNVLAVKHQLAVGIFDLKKIALPVRLAFAKGGEKFHGLGMDKPVPLMKGELCYFDARGMVMARDFNHLDSELAKVDEKSTDILLNVDGNSACTMEDVGACLEELEKLLKEYCGGILEEKVLVEAKA